MKKITISSRAILVFLFILYSLYVGIRNPRSFFSLATLYDMLRGSAVYGILALGFLPIIIAGGIDMSFSSVATFSTYVTAIILMRLNLGTMPVVLLYSIAIFIGVSLGFLNGYIVSILKAPIIVVTLGTSAMLSGLLLFIFGSTVIFNIPVSLSNFSKIALGTVTVGGVSSSFHPAIFIWIFLSICMVVFLKYTIIGRNIYAMGGNMSVFERSGASRRKLEITIFAISGGLSAIAGVTYSALYRVINPSMFIGGELDVIAMVILGGASINGGKGTVIGTIMGILFINLLKNSLILVNVPSIWQVFVVGIVLFVGVIVPILYDRYFPKVFTKGVKNE